MISRRHLFGLFAGAAVAPMLPPASRVMATEHLSYGWVGTTFPTAADPAILELVRRRIGEAEEIFKRNMIERLYGNGSANPFLLCERDDDEPL